MSDVHILSIPVGDPAGDEVMLLFKAPTGSNGGGISILAAEAVNGASTGVAAADGTTFSYQLLKYSNAGTPAVNGTITATALGGTADMWADLVPKVFTIDTPFVDAGEWVVLNYVETNSGNPTNSTITIQYVMGK